MGAKNGERKIAKTNPHLNFLRTHFQIMLILFSRENHEARVLPGHVKDMLY